MCYVFILPCDLKSWESSQTLMAPSICLFEYVKRFRNLRFTVTTTRNFQSSVLSSFEGRAATYSAFKQSLINSQLAYHLNGPAKFYTEADCDCMVEACFWRFPEITWWSIQDKPTMWQMYMDEPWYKTKLLVLIAC